MLNQPVTRIFPPDERTSGSGLPNQPVAESHPMRKKVAVRTKKFRSRRRNHVFIWRLAKPPYSPSKRPTPVASRSHSVSIKRLPVGWCMRVAAKPRRCRAYVGQRPRGRCDCW
jgi:hypothetical protein